MNYFSTSSTELERTVWAGSSSPLLEDANDLIADLGRELPSHDEGRNALEFLGSPDVLRLLIWDILKRPDALARSSSMSYRHALGFQKVVLRELPNGVQLRLHIWNSDVNRLPEDIHDHRYSFVSHVISGSLTNKLYVSDVTGKSYFEYRDYSLPSDNCWSFRWHAEVGVDLLSADVHTAGSTYLVTSDALHTVEVPFGTMASTLYIQFSTERSWTRVIKMATSAPPQTQPQVRFSEKELCSILIAYYQTHLP
jgi:hypothetical protein